MKIRSLCGKRGHFATMNSSKSSDDRKKKIFHPFAISLTTAQCIESVHYYKLNANKDKLASKQTFLSSFCSLPPSISSSSPSRNPQQRISISSNPPSLSIKATPSKYTPKTITISDPFSNMIIWLIKNYETTLLSMLSKTKILKYCKTAMILSLVNKKMHRWMRSHLYGVSKVSAIKPITAYSKEIAMESQFKKSQMFTLKELAKIKTPNLTVNDLKNIDGADVIQIVVNQQKIINSYAIHYNLRKLNSLTVSDFVEFQKLDGLIITTGGTSFCVHCKGPNVSDEGPQDFVNGIGGIVEDLADINAKKFIWFKLKWKDHKKT